MKRRNFSNLHECCECIYFAQDPITDKMYCSLDNERVEEDTWACKNFENE